MPLFEDSLSVLRRAATDPSVEGDAIIAAARRLTRGATGITSAERDALLDELHAVLLIRGPVSGVVAMVIGALLEDGGDPRRVQHWFVETLPGLLAACAEAKRALLSLAGSAGLEPEALDPLLDTLAGTEPGLVGSWRTLESFWPPFVAVLSASPSARGALRSHGPLARSLGHLLEGAEWIGRALGVLDDEPFVAIDPVARRGYAGTFGGIADNFQLHTLLAGALVGDVTEGMLPGAAPSPALLRCARGEGPQSSGEVAHGVWNLYDWSALRYDPTLTEASLIPHHEWIWGEGTPADIPTLDGVRLIGLGPASYARSWDGERMFSTMKAQLTVRERLDEAGVEAWLARIAQEGPQA